MELAAWARKLKGKLRGLQRILRFDNYFSLILNRTFYSRIGPCVYSLSGMVFIADHEAGDQNGTVDALVNGVYAQLVEGLPRDKKLDVLDLGANGGGFLLLLKSLGFSLGRTCAVEMNPYTFERLRFNIINNIGLESLLLNCAVSSGGGEMTVGFGKGNTSDSIFFKREENIKTKDIILDVFSIDQVIDMAFSNNEFDICKIDIEGSELEVFQSDPATFLRLRQAKNIIMEIHGGKDDVKSIVEKMGHIGFNQYCESDINQDVYLFTSD